MIKSHQWLPITFRIQSKYVLPWSLGTLPTSRTSCRSCPVSYYSGNIGLLAASSTSQNFPRLRALALAIPSAWKTFSLMCAYLTPSYICVETIMASVCLSVSLFLLNILIDFWFFREKGEGQRNTSCKNETLIGCLLMPPAEDWVHNLIICPGALDDA